LAPGSIAIDEPLVVRQLLFERGEEAFHHGVVVRHTLAAHTGKNRRQSAFLRARHFGKSTLTPVSNFIVNLSLMQPELMPSNMTLIIILRRR
jgi:hypothetical protein